jgi:hypothetical protein
MLLSRPHAILKPPVSRDEGGVCGKAPGGAGRKIGVPKLSVVGTVCKSVKRGAVEAVTIPAGLVRAVASPKAPF